MFNVHRNISELYNQTLKSNTLIANCNTLTAKCQYVLSGLEDLKSSTVTVLTNLSMILFSFWTFVSSSMLSLRLNGEVYTSKSLSESGDIMIQDTSLFKKVRTLLY